MPGIADALSAAPWMVAHYPWLTTSHTRDRTRVD